MAARQQWTRLHNRWATLALAAEGLLPVEFICGVGSATKGLGPFGVSYHETFDFFWIKGAVRCDANNFLGYDFD